MEETINYKVLYVSLFDRISRLATEIAKESDAADTKAEAFFLKLRTIMLEAEEQYLALTE